MTLIDETLSIYLWETPEGACKPSGGHEQITDNLQPSEPKIWQLSPLPVSLKNRPHSFYVLVGQDERERGSVRQDVNRLHVRTQNTQTGVCAAPEGNIHGPQRWRHFLSKKQLLKSPKHRLLELHWVAAPYGGDWQQRKQNVAPRGDRGDTNIVWCDFSLAANVEGEGLMSCTTGSHQGASRG